MLKEAHRPNDGYSVSGMVEFILFDLLWLWWHQAVNVRFVYIIVGLMLWFRSNMIYDNAVEFDYLYFHNDSHP